MTKKPKPSMKFIDDEYDHKLTNSPESELLARPKKDSSSIPRLREQIKDTALRPLAHRFGELTRQIDSGEYKLPKTIKEAEAITEDYINQATDRIMAEIAARESALLDKVEGLIGEDELIVGPTHESVLYRNNLKAELRTEIAKLRKEL